MSQNQVEQNFTGNLVSPKPGTVLSASQFLKELGQLKQQDLSNIKGLGEVLIKNLLDFTSSNRYQNLLSGFEKIEAQAALGGDFTSNFEHGLALQNEVQTSRNSNGAKILEIELENRKNQTSSGPLAGQVVCITGTFDISRADIASKLQAGGARVVDTISKATTILLAGQNAGSKLEKAKKLGIRVVENLNGLIVGNF